MRGGPLTGVRIVEVAGLGPVPFCGMMLADMGAEVVMVERPGGGLGSTKTALERNRRRIVLDLKSPDGLENFLRLVAASDALIEGYRPGVAERMGWGPDVCLARNARLVFGRVTGWGRQGPLSQRAGHDLNYLALNGVLNTIGTKDGPPIPPMNFVADFGGGGMLLAFGVVCAVLSARQTGIGQVVDAAMLDGSALFMAPFMSANGNPWGFEEAPGASLLAGAAPYYGIYETSDRRHLAVGAIERPFYLALLEGLGLAEDSMFDIAYPALDSHTCNERWPRARARIAERIKTRTLDDWMQVFAGVDACVSPVLPWSAAVQHPQVREQGTYVRVAGEWQPAPAPRFSATPPAAPTPAGDVGADTERVFKDWGVDFTGAQR